MDRSCGDPGYAADFRLFADWCAAAGLSALPATPGAVATYLASEATRGIRPATLGRRLAAIQFAHRDAGHPSPADNQQVRDVMAGIRNTLGTKPDRKAPVTHDRLADMLARIPADTLAGKRDRALLALGFACALRRSELVALTVEDVAFCDEGMRVTITRSKTDQVGEGYTIAVPIGNRLRPAEVVRAWLDAASITRGPLFRSINKAGRISAEGLTGRTVKIQAVSRHKTMDVLSGYVRDAEAFTNHAGSAFL